MSTVVTAHASIIFISCQVLLSALSFEQLEGQYRCFYDHFTDFFFNLDQHSIYSRSKDFLQHLQRAKNNSSICFLSKTHGSCQQLLWLRPRNMQMWLWWWNPSGICSVIKGFYFYYLLKKIIGSKKKVAQKMGCCFFQAGLKLMESSLAQTEFDQNPVAVESKDVHCMIWICIISAGIFPHVHRKWWYREQWSLTTCWESFLTE